MAPYRVLTGYALLALLAGSAGAAEPPARSTMPVVAAVHVRAVEGLTDREVQEASGLKAGKPLDPARVALGRDSAVAYLQARGYLEARVTAVTEVWASSAVVALEVAQGPRYRFGRVRIEGNERLPDPVVRRELPFDPGDPFDRQQLFAAQSRLFSLGLFDDVSVSASTSAAREAEVTVRVREQPMKWLKGGVGYGSEERERLSLILTHNNWLGRGYKLEGSATLSRIWLEYRGQFVNRWFLGTRTEARLDGSWRSEDRPGYLLERTRGESSLGRDLTRLTKGTLKHRLQRTLLFDVEPGLAGVAPEDTTISAASVLFSRDGSDDLFYPTRGTRANLALERSGGLLGGTVDFHKASGDAAAYLPLPLDVVLAAAARAGAVQEYWRSREVPIFERFFAGGAQSVRGYAERGVGPTDAAGLPLGGNYMSGASLELRFPLFWRLSGAAFVDGAMAAAEARDAQPSEWRYGAGGGVRLKTPVGPLRVDVGWKLHPDAGEKELWRLHLSLGEAF